MNLCPLIHAGRVFGPVVPVAFLNPPVVHRTAAILASERGTPVAFSAYREGVDLGASTGSGNLRRRLAATLKGLTQMLMGPRKALAATVSYRHSQAPDKVPAGRRIGSVRSLSYRLGVAGRSHATAANGMTGSSTLSGSGHPGYTATAVMIAEVALHMASRHPQHARVGCLTPALAIRDSGQRTMMASLELS